ncbi:hypothetical protein NJT12_04495 [Flavobacterium sp. AC]|uniref:Uncharacterized protein n=1 Tax=Flavobacterium azizsancarii TaxID=2961580 RepID=A0ABT4W9U4_9FLAO|nr:hypothetical protein [Flavobacterium azizsancarii]MDA6068874.1 hypothetical protein [Flavobacterium azizsancarii]
MRNLKVFFLIFSLLAFASIYAHKDRGEYPKSVKFIFDDKETLVLNYDDSRLGNICDEIISGKRKLTEAYVTYKTGEVVNVKFDGENCTSIDIMCKNKRVFVEKNILKKIKGIHFSTLTLSWSSDYDKAFSSSYFTISFDMGTERFYDEFPNVQLFFKKQVFSNAEVWKQISKNGRQGSKL